MSTYVLLALPMYLHEREASVDRARVCHSSRENSVSKTSPVARESTRKHEALFPKGRKSSQEAPSDRRFFLRISTSSRQQRTSIQILNPENSMKSFFEEHKITFRQNLKCESNNAYQIFSTILFVIFRDKLIPIVWKSIVPIKAMKNLEKSKPDFMKS